MAPRSAGPGSGSRIPVRHGASVAYVATIADAAVLMATFSQGTSVALQPPGFVAAPRSLLDEAGSAAKVVLDTFVKMLPLTGKARKNLGTALMCPRFPW